MTGPRASVAVIGGSGFYEFLDDAEEVAVETPYGDPSAPVAVGTVGGRPVAFLPRHGARPRLPAAPDQLPRQPVGAALARRPAGAGAVCGRRAAARAWRRATSWCPTSSSTGPAAGCRPTSRRGAVHVPFADPYCDRLVGAAVAAADRAVKRGGAMVVVEGPRFSTRAESQSYAAQGWSLVNMTGHPEAVLAREMRMCYAAVALVTDMDAGVEAGEGVGQAEVFAMFAAQHRAAQGHARHAPRRPAAPEGCPCSAWADGLDLTYERAREGAAHRRGRVHRRRDRRRARRRRRPRGGPGRRCCCRRPTACGAEPSSGHAPARRPRRRRRGPTCSTASTWSATRPRWSAPGVTVADLPAYAAHNDLGTAALLAAMTDAGVRRLVLASSMVVYGEGRYACPEHGAVAPRRARSTALEAGDFDNHCPTCGEPLGWELVDEDARLDPRSATPPARSPRSTTRPRGPGRPAPRAVGAALPQRLRARHAAGHAVLRRRGDVPLVAGARRGAAGLRGRRPDARLRARRRRRPRQPRWPSSPSVGATAGAFAAYNVCSGTPGLDPRGGRAGRPRARGGSTRR